MKADGTELPQSNDVVTSNESGDVIASSLPAVNKCNNEAVYQPLPTLSPQPIFPPPSLQDPMSSKHNIHGSFPTHTATSSVSSFPPLPPVSSTAATTPNNTASSNGPAVVDSRPQLIIQMKEKPKRDPNAPKRNVSGYILYQNAMRKQFKSENHPMSFGKLAKYTSSMYSKMTPAEKESWRNRAEQDKQRYLEDLKLYVAPPGYDARGDLIPTESENTQNSNLNGMDFNPIPIHKSQPYLHHYQKHPSSSKMPPLGTIGGPPKRNKSVYILYQNAMRSQFKQDNPGMTFGELAKYTSYMYKNLTPEEKAIWVQRAQEDKRRYEQEIASYVPTTAAGYPATGRGSRGGRGRRRGRGRNAFVDNRRGRGSYHHLHHNYHPNSTNRKSGGPKRASSSYIFFTNEMRPILMKQYPGIEFVHMGRILGERWRALSPEEKVPYENLAAEDKARFQMEMEQYNSHVGNEAQLEELAVVESQQQQHQAVQMQHDQYMQQQQQIQQQQQQQVHLQEQQQQQMQQQQQQQVHMQQQQVHMQQQQVHMQQQQNQDQQHHLQQQQEHHHHQEHHHLQQEHHHIQQEQPQDQQEHHHLQPQQDHIVQQQQDHGHLQ